MQDLEELYKSIQPKIYSFFYIKTLNKELAEDLTQEVFYNVVKGLSHFKGGCSPETWIFSIAKNLLKKQYRKNKYISKLFEKLSGMETTNTFTEQLILEKDEKRKLSELINSLEDSVKEIVILRVYGELSFAEIGQLVNRSENYARVTYHRAKLKLQKELEAYNG
jgi:RNA polymerase sigma-70 factor (ECF subfamily)